MRFAKAVLLLLACLFALPASAQLIPVEGRTPPPQTTDKANLWLLDLSTGGRVTIWLRPDAAPNTVERIKTLTRQHFYDGLAFHRVIPGFMAQGGDPKGDGTGGSTLPDLKAEFNYLPHVRGAVAAARAASDDSANSQFYIMFAPNLKLDKKYTIFGRVIEGMDYVDAIPPGQGDNGEVTGQPVRILHAYIAADNPPAYQAAPAPVAEALPVAAPVVRAPAAKKPAITKK